MAVMIGVDPHKASHTAVAIDSAEVGLGDLRVRASEGQLERLLAWARPWPERTWAIENAGGLGYLLAQQLVAAGERVVDVPPKLAARARLLNTGDTNKNDPNDARSVAIVALRSPQVRPVAAEGSHRNHEAVDQTPPGAERGPDPFGVSPACRVVRTDPRRGPQADHGQNGPAVAGESPTRRGDRGGPIRAGL